LATDTVSYDLPLTLFGKTWYMMDDYWMKHIHLKINDRCSAASPFCIESNSHIKEDKERFMPNVGRLREGDSRSFIGPVFRYDPRRPFRTSAGRTFRCYPCRRRLDRQDFVNNPCIHISREDDFFIDPVSISQIRETQIKNQSSGALTPMEPGLRRLQHYGYEPNIL